MTLRPLTLATVALAAALLVAPVASAERSDGGFVVDGALDVAATGTLELEPLAFFVNRTASLDAFEARSDRATVHRFEVTYIELQASDERVLVHRETRAAEYPLTNFRATAAGGGREGWLGLHTNAGASLRVNVGNGLKIDASETFHVGNAAIASEPEPNQPWYAVDVVGPHLRIAGPGSATLVGGGLVKVMGPAVTLASRENVTTFETGVERRATVPPTVVFRWLALEAQRWTVDVETRGPIVVVGPEAVGELDGTLSWASGRGRLQAASSDYVADGGAALLDGRFAADFAPAERSSTRVQLSGDLRSTNLEASGRAAVAVAPDNVAWIAGGLVVAGIVGAAVLALRRQKPLRPASGSADIAVMVEEGRWSDMLSHVRHLRTRDPHDSALALDEAFALAELGRVEEALGIYHAVAERTADGAAEYLAAALTIYAGGSHDEVEDLLERAVAKRPALAKDLAEDTAFVALRERPSFQRLAQRGDAL